MTIRYVYHEGSGTYIDAEECVILEVSEEVNEAISRGDVDISTCEVEREESLPGILANLWGNV